VIGDRVLFERTKKGTIRAALINESWTHREGTVCMHATEFRVQADGQPGP